MRLWIAMVCLVCVGMASPLQDALAKAKAQDKLVWVFVELSRCPWCLRMREEIIQSGVYAKELETSYVLVTLMGEEAKQEGLRVEHYPTSVLLNPEGKKMVDMLPGYMKSEHFVEYLKLLYEIEKEDK